MDQIPKLIEQYQSENAKLEKGLPTLRQIVGGEWKKENELKQLKSEVAGLEQKIQLTLSSSRQQISQTSGEEKIASITKKVHIVFPLSTKTQDDLQKKILEYFNLFIHQETENIPKVSNYKAI